MGLEIWKPFCSDRHHEVHEVSSLGRIRIKTCVVKTEVINNKTFFNDAGVAALVLETFVRKRKLGERSRHKNGVTTDDRVENLEWVSAGSKGSKGSKGKGSKEKTSIEVIFEGQDPLRFDTMKEAGDLVGVSGRTIKSRLDRGFVDGVSVVRVARNQAKSPGSVVHKELSFGNKVVTVSSDGRVSIDGGDSWMDSSTCGGFRIVTLEFDREGVEKRMKPGRLLRQSFNVHRLVCEAFHGPCPDLCFAKHKDNNKKNNDADNLEWESSVNSINHNVKEELREVSEAVPDFQGLCKRRRRK